MGAFLTTTGLADTVRAQVSSRFDALKATEVRVQDAAPDGTDPFPSDVDARLQALNGVNAAGTYYAIPDPGWIEPRTVPTRAVATRPTIPVIAATPGAINASLPTVLTGRVYDQWHESRGERVAVIGRIAAAELGVTRIDNQPVVFLDDTAYSIVGILDGVLRNPDLLLSIIIPTSAASAQFDTHNVTREVIVDTSAGAAQLIGHQAPIALRPQGPERLRAIVPPDPQALRNQVEGDVQSLFYALSALALLIGTVAIANASLLSIVERRPEIGLRRALGATRRHIMLQFIVEAAITGTLAGVVGATLGVLALSVIAIAREWTPTLDSDLLLAAPVIGITTGTIAGLFPALKAARTPPVETIRT